MPHSRSDASLANRRLRALDRGFLVAKHGGVSGKYVLVANDIAPRVKAMADSLACHVDHDRIVGTSSHVARNATHVAKPLPPLAEVEKPMKIDRAANLDKHGSRARARWADACEHVSSEEWEIQCRSEMTTSSGH